VPQDPTGTLDAHPLRRPARGGLVWWTAALFILGALLFALGVPCSLAPRPWPAISGAVFFIGSLFFTAAAFLQFLTAIDAAPRLPQHRALRWAHPRDLDWASAVSQLVGTLLFNLNTLAAAVLANLAPRAQDRLVWYPDALGSALFLLSSLLALLPEVRARRHQHVWHRSQTMAWLNLAGSLWFALAAIGALVLPATGQSLDQRWANVGTFVGALCFLVAAWLLLPPTPEQRHAGPGSPPSVGS
jgi:hypothetical protein